VEKEIEKKIKKRNKIWILLQEIQMVSDILFDAIEDIKDYKRKMPEIYIKNKEISKRLNATIKVMREMQQYLDKPPELKKE
jgi:hypothetical protein